jgi:hypothetical protein
MTHRNRVRYSRLSLGLIAALAAAPVFAQSTSAGIGGLVTDNSGQPVAGAEVVIRHVESGTVSRATTDASGRYNARGLRVGGPYEVIITKPGTGTTTENNVFLGLDQVSQVNAALTGDIASLDAVTVVGVAGASDIFSATRMGAGTDVSSAQLEGLASIQRNLQDYARLDPRLSQTDKERGEISAGGQNTRFNSITIDGVTTNDTFGLEANNLPTLKQPISIDAIESVQVNISNYDVSQAGYTGANINAVTKSGTNTFSGSVYYVYRDDSLAGDRYNRTTDSYFDPPRFKEETTGFTFGGPLIKDRLFFFASYEELESSRNALNFGPLGSERTNVAITQSAIDGARNIATTYGFDAGEVDIDQSILTVKDSLVKLDANITENHRASLRWSKTEQSEPLFPTNFNNAIALSSHWYAQNKTIETYVGELFSDWTDNFSTAFKVSYRDYASAPANNSNLPQIRLNFAGALPPGSPAVSNTSAGLVLGTERSRHFNDLATETWNYSLAANWFLGDHELKFGFDYEDNEVYNAFLQDTKGNYTFACLNTSATLTYQFNGGAPLTCNTATRAQNEAAVLENFRRGRPSSYQVQVGLPGFTLDDGVATWDYQNLGLFLQDTWAINYNLTLMAGVRVDKKNMDTAPVFNPAAAAAPVAGAITGNTTPHVGTITRASGGFGIRNDVTLDGNSLVQPRFGFNYTFDSERRTQLRGGFGLFEGAAANVWLSNPYSNTGMTTAIIGCGIAGFASCPTTDGLFNPNPDQQPTNFSGAIPAPNVDFLSSDLDQPSVWKFNVALDHELPWWNMVVSAEYIRTEVKSGIYYKHLNLGNPTAVGVDGRQLFYTPQGLNTACWNNNGSTITTGACAGHRARALNNPNFNNVLLAENTSKGHGDNFSISLSGMFAQDWNWSLGYSMTRATEVSPLTSSVANSNWNSVSVFNTNEEVAANSAYLVRDRFVGQLNWSKAFFGNYKTRAGLFYEGRSGKPYSWRFFNDLNGDGNANDLMYIPRGVGSGEVVFRDTNGNGSSADEEARFWQFAIENNLTGYAGTVVPRNSHFGEWTNSFDLRFSQELPGFFPGNKTVLVLDILNVGNLINKDWGRIDEVVFQSAGGQSRSFVDALGLTADGRYVYGVRDSVQDLTTRQVRGESQWAAQFTIRYQF